MLLPSSRTFRALLVSVLILAFTIQFQIGGTPVTASRQDAAGEQSGFEPLPNFDLRLLRAPSRLPSRPEVRKPLFAGKAPLDRVGLSWNDVLDLPHHLISLAAPLTDRSSDDAVDIAKRFVEDNRSLYAISSSQLDAARVCAQESSERDGFTRLVLEQQVNGTRVFDSEMLFALDREGRIWSVSGSFIPQIEQRAPEASAALAPENALRIAAEYCGGSLSGDVAVKTDDREGRKRLTFLSDAVDPRSEASLVYYPVARDEIRLAYQVLLYGVPSMIDAYLLLVDAHSGELLRRDSLTFAAEAPMGLVFTKESPQAGERETVSFEGSPTTSPAGWVGTNRTSGNNARVYFNPDLDGGTLVRMNSDGNFEFPIDLTLGHSPLDSSRASASNLFYWVNVAHDKFYALGFNESSRNFQTENFDKGGRGEDSVRADTLRGANINPSSTTQPVRNNAFFQTSVDGTQPLLAMLLWSVATPTGQIVNLDSSYDAGVIIHEYTHGVSTRLAGTDTSTGLRSTQGGGMGEGWSDFFAMSFLSGDLPLDTIVPTGSYIIQRKRGVRNFPYCTRFEVDPLTLGDIQAFTEVHAQGTVWCSMLWDLRQSFIERYGFEAGKEAAERAVINGLRLLPLSPTFVDARDAILLADRMSAGGANQGLIWRSFARRGLGKSAVTALTAPSTGYRMTVTEAYDIPAELSAGSLIIDDRPSTPAVIGEPLPLVVVDRDLSAASSVEVSATNLRTGAALPIQLGQTLPGRFAGSLTCGSGQEAGAAARLAVEPGDQISISYSNARNEAGTAEKVEVRTVAGRRIEVSANDFERDVVGWLLTSFWHLTERRSASPNHSLYFAKQKGENEAKSFTPAASVGSALTPSSSLTSLAGAKLEMDYLFIGALAGDQANPAGDLFTLTAANFPFSGVTPLSPEDPRLQVVFDLRPQSDAVFRHVTIDLRTIGGRTTYMILSFSASRADLARKKLEGLYLDNLRLTAVMTR